MTRVDAALDHSLAVHSDGTAWASGANRYGELGDGTQTQRLSPVQVPGLTDVVALAGGQSFSLAVTAAGDVWAWGLNHLGQLGDGTGVLRLSPVRLPAPVDVIAVSAGFEHSLALRTDRSVWAGGSNVHGQLGRGHHTRSHPRPVADLTEVTAISAGWAHSLGARTDGTAWGWGYNRYGPLGDGTTANRRRPVQTDGSADLRSLYAAADGALYAAKGLGRNQFHAASVAH